MMKHTYCIHNSHVLPGALVSFNTLFVLCLTSLYLLSAGFWCWKCGSDYQSLIHKCQSTSRTLLLISTWALSEISVFIAPRVQMISSSRLMNWLSVAFHKHHKKMISVQQRIEHMCILLQWQPHPNIWCPLLLVHSFCEHWVLGMVHDEYHRFYQ